MDVLYIATAGVSDPTRASLPFHLAVNGSVAVGQTAGIALAGDAADVVVGDNAQAIEGLGLPPLRELLAKVREHNIPVYV